MVAALDAGHSLILFPEGTRGVGAELGRFKGGIADVLARRPDVTVIPFPGVTIGASKLPHPTSQRHDPLRGAPEGIDNCTASRRACALDEARFGSGGRRIEVGAENFVKRSHVSC